MSEAEKVIQDYLDVIEKVKGVEAREQLEVRWAGGTQVVIRKVGSNKGRLVDVGFLRLATEQLSKAA